MSNKISPASGKRQGLDNDSYNVYSSTKNHTKVMGIIRLQLLNEIAAKWVDKGCYESPGKALQELIGGDL